MTVTTMGHEGAEASPPSAYTEVIPAAKLDGHEVVVAIAKAAR